MSKQVINVLAASSSEEQFVSHSSFLSQEPNLKGFS